MRTAQALNELVRWRWTPFAAIVGASTIYVAIVALAVPDRIEFARTSRSRSVIGQPAAGTTETTNESSAATPTPTEHLSPSLPPSPMGPAQNFGPRGFSPVERPDTPAELVQPPPPPITPPPAEVIPPPPIPPSQPDEQPAPPPPPVATAPMDGAQGPVPQRGPMQVFGVRQVQQIAAAVRRDAGGAGGAPPAPPPANP